MPRPRRAKAQARRKPPSLARALEQAAKAGKPVRAADWYADHVSLTFGEPDTPVGSKNSWDEVLNNAADQKRPA
jgi:hypothetical protein